MAFKKEILEIIEPRDVFVGNPKAEVTLEEFGEYGLRIGLDHLEARLRSLLVS